MAVRRKGPGSESYQRIKKEMENAKFLAGAAKVFQGVREEFERIIGGRIEQPALEIDPSPKKGRLARFDFTGGAFRILLNPNEEVTPETAGHEFIHSIRLVEHRRLHTTGDRSTEEAFAIVGEAIAAVGKLPQGERKKAVCDYLEHCISKGSSAFEFAESIVREFDAERLKPDFGIDSFGLREKDRKERRSRESMQNAMKKAEKKVDRSGWEEYERAPTEYMIGSGLALILFINNDFDLEKTLRQVTKQRLERIQLDTALALTENSGRITSEIKELSRQRPQKPMPQKSGWPV